MIMEEYKAMQAAEALKDYLTKKDSPGLKHDADKLDLSLLDYELFLPVIEVLKVGEAKYGYENWKKSFGANYRRRFRAALRRHDLASHNNPLARNLEDGNVYHLAQVAINALFELYHAIKEQEHGVGGDHG